MCIYIYIHTTYYKKYQCTVYIHANSYASCILFRICLPYPEFLRPGANLSGAVEAKAHVEVPPRAETSAREGNGMRKFVCVYLVDVGRGAFLFLKF